MRNFHLRFVLIASLVSFANVQAAPANLPETGQVTCYNANGTASISCTATGQDGDAKAGVAWPNSRFVVGTGATADCVTDTLTGLMWVRAPSSISIGYRNWTNALASANNLTLCGFSDWRLPNINELESLVNSEFADQAAFLNTQGFNNVPGTNYWSSTSIASNASDAWSVSLTIYGGEVSNDGKANNGYVWPVRAGQ